MELNRQFSKLGPRGCAPFTETPADVGVVIQGLLIGLRLIWTHFGVFSITSAVEISMYILANGDYLRVNTNSK